MTLFSAKKNISINNLKYASSFVSGLKSDNMYIEGKSTKKFHKEIMGNIKASYVSPYLKFHCEKFLTPFYRKKPERSLNYCFVADSEVASDIAEKILNEKKLADVHYIEGNPGVGLITKRLLDSGTKVDIYDSTLLKKFCLNQIAQTFPGRLKIFHRNIFDSRNSYLHQYLLTKTKKTVVGVVPNLRYFFGLLSFVTVDNNWQFLRYVNFYLVVSSDVMDGVIEFKKMLSANFKGYCLFNLLFDYEVLCTYERKHFLPLPKSSKNSEMFLIKFTKKRKVKPSLNNDEFQDFLDLLTILRRSRYQFVIPVLEHSIPNCGLHLIRHGFSMSIQTQDLNPSETVLLFDILKKIGQHDKLTLMSGRISGKKKIL